jgi:agmatinase
MFGARDVDTFLGVERVRDLRRIRVPIVIIGADTATPYPTAGAYCAGGPAAIRAASTPYSAIRDHVNFDLGTAALPDGCVGDAGDLPQKDDDAQGNRARIFGAVDQILEAGSIPVLLGGDDSLPIPMLEAYGARGDFWVVQIDAHIDWRDEVQGERLGLSSTMRRISEMDHVAGIVQIGQRGIGSARTTDFLDARKSGVHFVPGGEVARDGVGRAIDLIPWDARVVVCFDCDAIDPSVMPAVIGRTPGGLSYWQALELIAGVAAKARITGFALTEFMPSRDIDGLGGMLAAQLLNSVLGLIAPVRVG